jgi:hypothetical protein
MDSEASGYVTDQVIDHVMDQVIDHVIHSGVTRSAS